MLAAAAFTFAVASPVLADDHGHEDETMVEETTTEDTMEMEVCHDEEGEEVACPEDMTEEDESEAAESDMEDETDEESY